MTETTETTETTESMNASEPTDSTDSTDSTESFVPLDLTGTSVLITGGTKNIGLGITRAFLATGAHVVTCARTAPEEPIRLGDSEAHFIATDVRDAEQCEALVAATVERHGRLDILINNAGGGPPFDSTTASTRLAERIIALNLTAAYFMSVMANRVMREQEDGGLILNVGSIAGREPLPGTAAYAAAKAGLSAMTKAMAFEYGPKVRVNEVVVGLVHTDLSEMHYGGAEALRRISSTIASKRMVTPADIANSLLLFCGPGARHFTGAAIECNGGGTLPAWLIAAAPKVPVYDQKPPSS